MKKNKYKSIHTYLNINGISEKSDIQEIISAHGSLDNLFNFLMTDEQHKDQFKELLNNNQINN